MRKIQGSLKEDGQYNRLGEDFKQKGEGRNLVLRIVGFENPAKDQDSILLDERLGVV